MKKVYPELPDWTFDVNEVSAGVYEVLGRSSRGQTVNAKGTDVYALINECKQRASDLSTM